MHPPARFVSHLVPGQRAEPSVADADGGAPVVPEFAYDGDRDRLVVRATAEPQV